MHDNCATFGGMAKPAKTTAKPASSIRWRPEDCKLLAALQKKTGVGSVAELARMSLRALAAKEGIQ